MATQLLFYKEVAPVSAKRHSEVAVKAGKDYSFAKTTNSVPLTAVEFRHAAQEYPIVFVGEEGNIMPVIILGLKNDDNIHVNEEGAWTGAYIPAFVRRYPFVFSQVDESDSLTLCIDEAFSGFNKDGVGEKLFDSEGERTNYLEQVLEFQKSFQAQHQLTQAFCKKLHDLKLLEPIQAGFKDNKTGKQQVLNGFQAINRDKLKGLSDEELLGMMKSDEMELAFLHLQSMNNLGKLSESFAADVAKAQTEEVEAPVTH